MHATSIPCCSHKAIIFATAESLDAYLTVRVASQEHGFPYHAVNWRKARQILKKYISI